MIVAVTGRCCQQPENEKRQLDTIPVASFLVHLPKLPNDLPKIWFTQSQI